MRKISIILFICTLVYGATPPAPKAALKKCTPLNGVERIATGTGDCVIDCTQISNSNRREACIINQVGRLKKCESYYCKVNPYTVKCRLERLKENQCMNSPITGPTGIFVID